MVRNGKFLVALFMAIAVAFLTTGLLPAQAPAGPAELKLLKPISLGGTGNWDYPLIDSAARRLYIARATRVMVMDLDKGTLVGEVSDVPGAHGVAVFPEKNLGFATSGSQNAVVVFDLKSLKVISKVKTGKNPDAILFDPSSKKVFAFCHSDGTVTVIDPANLDKEPAAIAVGGVLEFGASDGVGRVFVNVEDKNECVAIDSKQLKIVARWSLGKSTTPTGLDMDTVRHRLFVGCRGDKVAAPSMVVLDFDSGKILATLPIGAGVDGVAYDAEIGAVSGNGKDGNATVVRETAPGKFEVVQTIPTYPGAKTIAVDTKTHQFYLPANLPEPSGKMFGVAVLGRG